MLKNIAIQATLLIALLLSTSGIARAQKDKVEGTWLNEEKEAKVMIYKSGNGKFYGKITWLKFPIKDGKPKTDYRNADEKLQSAPLLGLVILKDFTPDGQNYGDGTIYDPKKGKTYSCKMTYVNSNTLSIRGYIGVSLFGRTTTWTRTTD